MKHLKFILICLLFLPLCSCLDTMQEQDHTFVDKIKQHLKKKGDIVKVSDIHPGDWTKVCFTVGDGVGDDALDAVASFTGLDKKNLLVINRKKEHTQFVEDFDWGIYFFYPPNKVEYFVIYRAEMNQGSVLPQNSYMCSEKERAYFHASSDWERKENRNSYFRISIIENNQGVRK